MASSGSAGLNAWQLTRQVHRELVGLLDTELIEDVGMDLRTYEALFYLNNAPSKTLRLGELTESLLLKPAAATRFLDRMERSARIRRRPAKDDRRAVVVTLTGKGQRDFDTARPVHDWLVGQHFGERLTHEEDDLLNDVLDRVLQTLRSARTAM